MFDPEALERMAARRRAWEAEELKAFLERQPESRPAHSRRESPTPEARVEPGRSAPSVTPSTGLPMSAASRSLRQPRTAMTPPRRSSGRATTAVSPRCAWREERPVDPCPQRCPESRHRERRPATTGYATTPPPGRALQPPARHSRHRSRRAPPHAPTRQAAARHRARRESFLRPGAGSYQSWSSPPAARRPSPACRDSYVSASLRRARARVVPTEPTESSSAAAISS